MGIRRFPEKNPNQSGSFTVWNWLYNRPATTPAIIQPSVPILIVLSIAIAHSFNTK